MNEETSSSSGEMEGSGSATSATSNWLIPLAVLVALAATFITETPDLWQIVLPVTVFVAYLLFWSPDALLRHSWFGRQQAPQACRRGTPLGSDRGRALPGGAPQQRRHPSQLNRKSALPKQELRQDSKVPVHAPSFASEGFSAQTQELLQQITPTPESERLAQQLAQCAKTAIQKVFPEVEVVGFASGDVARGTAFGVAVPELDIVASSSPHILVNHLQGRLSKGGLSMAKLDTWKLQKSAIRVCTDYLVSEGGFKFRRSAFRGQEPKVTLMAPPCICAAGKRIPVDFSVNSMTPLYNAALLAECGRIDTRARSLILLVRRWAKDRGVCHAAKGHLAPYAWTLLAIYFMQVGMPVLPPLQGFKMASGLAVRRGSDTDPKKGRKPGESASKEAATPITHLAVSDLFIGFVGFYARSIDWHKEAVSVRLGKRASANLHLMLHIIVHEDQSTEVGPSIEDPFEPARNLGMSTTSVGMARLREEFLRAHSLTGRGASLSELLEPWVPAERARGSSDEEDDVTAGGAEDPAASFGGF